MQPIDWRNCNCWVCFHNFYLWVSLIVASYISDSSPATASIASPRKSLVCHRRRHWEQWHEQELIQIFLYVSKVMKICSHIFYVSDVKWCSTYIFPAFRCQWTDALCIVLCWLYWWIFLNQPHFLIFRGKKWHSEALLPIMVLFIWVKFSTCLSMS